MWSRLERLHFSGVLSIPGLQEAYMKPLQLSESQDDRFGALGVAYA